MKTILKQTEKMKSAAILNNDYSIKNKYLVTVFVQKVDSEANAFSENFEYIFNEGSILERRRNAIQKAQDIMVQMGKINFLHFQKQKQKNLKITNVIL